MNGDAVLEALAGQLGWYRRLCKLAELQHEHVRQGRTEQLLDLLKDRQQVLEQIADFERRIGPVKRQWTQYLSTLNGTDRAEAESMLSETRRLLEEITSADKDDALVLQQRKLNLGRQINQTAAARQFNRAYSAAAYGAGPSRMDVHR